MTRVARDREPAQCQAVEQAVRDALAREEAGTFESSHFWPAVRDAVTAALNPAAAPDAEEPLAAPAHEPAIPAVG